MIIAKRPRRYEALTRSACCHYDLHSHIATYRSQCRTSVRSWSRLCPQEPCASLRALREGWGGRKDGFEVDAAPRQVRARGLRRSQRQDHGRQGFHLKSVDAREQSTSKEILLWMTPSEAPMALQASECSELLDHTRASCWIVAQRWPGKFMVARWRHRQCIALNRSFIAWPQEP